MALAFPNVTEGAFKIAGGIIPLLVASDMLVAKRQQRKRTKSKDGGEPASEDPDVDNLAAYPLAIPLLTGPSAIMYAILVNTGFTEALARTLTG